MSINASAPIAPVASNGKTGSSNKTNPLLETGKGKGEDHFSFWDVLDVINPLQHIPIVSNIYRSITGDQISNVARVAGDALYGGVVGAAFGLANAVAVHEAGDDLGGVALSKMGLLDSQETAQKPDSAAGASSGKPLTVEVHPSDRNLKDQIIWDQPVKAASADLSSQAIPPAMPTPKELNDITPGDGTIDPSISKKDVQQNMMAALNKYQAMQESAQPGVIIADPLKAATPKNIFAMPASAPSTMVADNAAPAKQPTAAYNKLRHFTH